MGHVGHGYLPRPSPESNVSALQIDEELVKQQVVYKVGGLDENVRRISILPVFDPQRKVARLPCSPLDISRTRPNTHEKVQSDRLHI